MATPTVLIQNIRELNTNLGITAYGAKFNNDNTITLGSLDANSLLYTNASKIVEEVTMGNSLSLTTGTLDTKQDIQTSASPSFAALSLTGAGGLDVNTIDEYTLNAGVTIEGVLIKDSSITLTQAITKFDIDGTFAANSDSYVATQKATKTYVDNKFSAINWKEHAKAATDDNVDLTTGGLIMVDTSYQTVDGDRIVVWKQTLPAQNGIYIAHTGAWTRAADADTSAKLINATVFVSMGDTYADTSFVCTNNAGFTLDTDPVVFVQSASAVSHNQLNGLQGGTEAQYYHLNSDEHTTLSALSDNISSIVGSVITFIPDTIVVSDTYRANIELMLGTGSTTTANIRFTRNSLAESTVRFLESQYNSPINVSVTGNFISTGFTTTPSLVYSDADKKMQQAAIGTSLTFAAGTLNTVQDIRTSASPQFTGLVLTGTETVDTINEYTTSAGTTINGTNLKSVGVLDIPTGNTYSIKINNTEALGITATNVTAANFTANSTVYVDTIAEKTSANGVSIDGTKIKDGIIYPLASDSATYITNDSGSMKHAVATGESHDFYINGVLVMSIVNA